jgi:hypothetical protein
MTSALIGASRVEQIEQNVAALGQLEVLRRGIGPDRRDSCAGRMKNCKQLKAENQEGRG